MHTCVNAREREIRDRITNKIYIYLYIINSVFVLSASSKSMHGKLEIRGFFLRKVTEFCASRDTHKYKCARVYDARKCTVAYLQYMNARHINLGSVCDIYT